MRPFQPVLLGLFLMTGLSGLVYELLWARMFSLVFGATVLAVSTVLAAFFAGLALGSWAFGQVVDRYGKPLLLYGLLEIGTGLYAAFVPSLISHAQVAAAQLGQQAPDSFLAVSLARFGFCFALVLVPTTLMGGSLPVLARFAARPGKRIGRDLGLLYGANTIGAAMGCMATGFFLVEYTGVSAAHALAIAVSVAVGIVALALHRAADQARPQEAKSPRRGEARRKSGQRRRKRRPTPRPVADGAFAPYPRRLVLAVICAFGISGATALSFEVLWTRNLAITLHSTTYSFTVILAAFLCGIGLGSFLCGRFLQGTAKPVFWFGATQVGIGLHALALIHVFGVIPDLASDWLQPLEAEWGASVAVQLLLCFAVMLVPTLLMGCAFPLVGRICASGTRRLGTAVGNVYAANCVGAIAGSFLAGFAIIPLLGVKEGMMLVSAVSLAVGASLMVLSPAAGTALKRLATASTAALAAIGLLAAHATRLYVGVGSSADARRILFYEDGLVANVRVEQTPDDVLLLIDNKVQAGRLGARASQGLGHIPMLLHRQPRRVLTIGMGAGMTAGAVARHPVESMHIVDLVESLAQTAPYFSRQNHAVLDDERARFVVGDGRNFLLATDLRFDVIVADIFFPAGAGTGSLYSLEHYRLAAARLADGGLMVQWLPLYQLAEEEFRMVAATFLEAFPGAELWLGDPDMRFPVVGLVGRNGPAGIDLALLSRRLANPEVSRELVYGDDAISLLCAYLMGGPDLAGYVSGVPLNTDDRPRIEFSAPRNDYTNRRYGWETIQKLARRKGSVVPLLDPGSLASEGAGSIAGIERREAAVRHFRRGTFALGNGQAEDAYQAYREARALAPSDAFIDFHTSESIGRLHATLGDAERAATLLESAVRLRPDEAGTRLLLADLYAAGEQWDLAQRHLEQLVGHHAEHAVALGRLGEIHARQERWGPAASMLGRALDILPAPDPHLAQLHAGALRRLAEGRAP